MQKKQKTTTVIGALQGLGIKSDHAYIGGMVAIGLTWASYLISRGRNKNDKSQADRWGIFFGTWAPTMFAVGTALRLEESRGKKS